MTINNDFSVETLELSSVSDSTKNRLIASLIRSKHNTNLRSSVLYLHGFVDYFFHTHVTEALHDAGYDFYALDLRRCGRSYLPGQRFNYCDDIKEYFEEITLAIDYIQAKNSSDLFFLAHSTGGLTACQYLNFGERRTAIRALLLNSPFLAIPRNGFLTSLLNGVSKMAAALIPGSKIDVPGLYTQSVSAAHHGEWDFDLTMKPADSFPIYFQWVQAILKAQQELQVSDIKVPILLMHSSQSLRTSTFSEAMLKADTVLDVEDMRRIGPKLGKDVTLIEIENGMHDLFLSPSPVRKNALTVMINWLAKIKT